MTHQSSISVATLVAVLRQTKSVQGTHYQQHHPKRGLQCLRDWNPSGMESRRYISSDVLMDNRYSRHTVFLDEDIEILLLCWPAGSSSTMHDHGESSCWLRVLIGQVHEARHLTADDRRVTERLSPGDATYINNGCGLHQISNRSDSMAVTIHVYAPPLCI
jgi:cysteine dioxygenase